MFVKISLKYDTFRSFILTSFKYFIIKLKIRYFLQNRSTENLIKDYGFKGSSINSMTRMKRSLTQVSWDKTVSQVRMLQAAVAECIKETVSDAAYARLLNVMNGSYVSTYRYITQYIDILNDKFINMSNEKRLKNITTFAKRIAECNKEYRELEADLKEEARRRNCRVEDLQLAIDYPDEIEW